jgi:aspartate ammonia-lyase
VAENEKRVERDALGEVEVPKEALWGVHTARARQNFAVSGVMLGSQPALISAFGHVKVAAARANADLGELDEELATPIVAAGREVAAGQHDAEFPLEIVQGGGGTSTNMNANEVIANRANQLLGGKPGEYAPVHPNDHVNRSQSTNDVYPTAMLLSVIAVAGPTLEGLRYLESTLDHKAAELGDLERLGRTCLQDALPLPAAAAHRAQASGLRRVRADLERSLQAFRFVPIGATVIGTGFGAPVGYIERVVSGLAEESGLSIEPAPDLFDALAHLDGYVSVISDLSRASGLMAKIAADLRFLSSGPVGEVRLPALQAGSSAMPGKVNPVLPELVLQVSYEIRGAVATIEAAVAGGELELNVMEPVIARHVLESFQSVGAVARLFADRCISGLQYDERRTERNLEGSYAELVEFAATEGYSAAAEAARSRPDPTSGS